MRERQELFFPLDNSAIFMAAIAGRRGPFIYQFYVELRHPVVLPALEMAVERLFPRFPYLFVRLRRGVFWQYLEPLDKPPPVERLPPAPGLSMGSISRKGLLRIYVRGRRIACEFHHAITDGTGAITFLKALVVEYCRQLGIGRELDPQILAGIPQPEEAVDPAEYEDSYNRYFRPGPPVPENLPPAFVIPGWRMRFGYRETISTIPLEPLLSYCRGKKVSITEFLVAVHIATLQDLYGALPPKKQRKSKKIISVQVPVNLRKIYPSRTLRNFFLFVAPYIDLRLGFWSFEEILKRVHHQMQLGLEEKELGRQIKRNVGGERNPFNRVVALPIKLLVLKLINALIGVGSYSGSLSNIGAIEVPPPFDAEIERFSFLTSRAHKTGANIGVCSFKETLYIIIGSTVGEAEFERFFFRRLASCSLPVTVLMERYGGNE
ncbi:MAG: hypothetical protein WHT84_02075 [Breznakiellaceae bacterium]